MGKKNRREHFDWGNQGEKTPHTTNYNSKIRPSKRKKKNYLRDNSVILSKRPNRRERLRPRCWTKATKRCRSLERWACSALKALHDLSSGRRKLGRFLSSGQKT